MFVLADNYMFAVENARISLFYGRVGSYKTLSAVATAYKLLKSGRYKRVYSNIPCSFASSPPDVEKFDFMNYEYASDSIFIIDESGLFLAGTHKEMSTVFAMPRKLNQVFLLASVIPTKQIQSYCHLFVTRSLNFSILGFPVLQFQSGGWLEKKPPKHYIAFYAKYFPKFASKFRPDSMYPIRQFRDRGILYDRLSRPIPREIVQYYYLDSWSQAQRKRNLTPAQSAECDVYAPTFDTSHIFDTETEAVIPKVKQQFSLKTIGTEFRISFFIKLALIIYLTAVGGSYVVKSTPQDPPIGQWTQGDIVQILQLKSLRDKPKSAPQPTITPERRIIEWKYESTP